MGGASAAFGGFSLPDGAWFPPEVMRLLPSLNMAELKVTIAAIYETMQVAGSGAIISLTDFEALTGLSRKSVLRGIHEAVKRGSIRRTQVAGTYIYRLAVNGPGGSSTPAEGEASTPIGGKSTPIGVPSPPNSGKSPPNSGKSPPNGGKSPPHDMYACNTYSLEQESLHATDGKSTPPDARSEIRCARPELVAEMRDLGVALKVCQNIAGRYDDAYIIEKLRHARYALEAGLAKNPAGWFVAAVKDDWPAPLGYDPDAHLTDEERRLRYISGEYGHLIQH